jgi:hypothetical protein
LTRLGQMRHARVMFRRAPVEIPIDLRERLEAARLDLLALFRALDRMHLAPEQIPQRLIRHLFELDADYVEALWALDQSPGTINPQAMLRDTLATLGATANGSLPFSEKVLRLRRTAVEPLSHRPATRAM